MRAIHSKEILILEERAITFGTGLRGIVCGNGTKGPIIIAHGAGKGMDSSILKKTAENLAELGFVTLRFNFAYIDKKSAPSFGGKKEEPDLVAAIDAMKEYGAPILIGKSFGARVCANVSLARKDIRALVFYGMPLQGASPTAKPRDWSHLARISSPMLFITGDKDQLCPLSKLEPILESLTGEYASQVVSGDHSFKPKSEDLAVKICTDWVAALTS